MKIYDEFCDDNYKHNDDMPTFVIIITNIPMIMILEIYHMLGLSALSHMLYLRLFVFVFCVFARLTHGNIIFDILE